MKSNNIIKSGVLQLDTKLGKTDVNVDTALEALHRMGKADVDISVLPEMWSCGFDSPRLSDHAEGTPGILTTLSGIAAEYGMIIAGTLPEKDGSDIYNTFYVIDKDGTIAGAYRKIHLFKLTGEHKFFKNGTEAVTCETSIGPIGLLTCYELRFPELCRTLALKGAEIIIISAQWPAVRIQHWDALIQARAIENQAFVIAANRYGKDLSLNYVGHSQVVSPSGEVVAMADERICSIEAEMDLAEIDEFRNRIPCLLERVPPAYEI